MLSSRSYDYELLNAVRTLLTGSSSTVALDKRLNPHVEHSPSKFAKLRNPDTGALVADETAEAVLETLDMQDDEAASHAKKLVLLTARYKHHY